MIFRGPTPTSIDQSRCQNSCFEYHVFAISPLLLPFFTFFSNVLWFHGSLRQATTLCWPIGGGLEIYVGTADKVERKVA